MKTEMRLETVLAGKYKNRVFQIETEDEGKCTCDLGIDEHIVEEIDNLRKWVSVESVKVTTAPRALEEDIMDMNEIVLKLTKEERKNLEHCLLSLKSNKIDCEDLHRGWYCGNKAIFIKRHLKAISMIEKWLDKGGEENGSKD